MAHGVGQAVGCYRQAVIPPAQLRECLYADRSLLEWKD